jgi:hypothetical protein
MAALRLNASMRAVSFNVRVFPTLRTSTPSELLPIPSSEQRNQQDKGGKKLRRKKNSTWVLLDSPLNDLDDVLSRQGVLFHVVVAQCDIVGDCWFIA